MSAEFDDKDGYVAKWVPILMEDQEWDYGYLLTIMLKKITFMRDHFKEYGITENNDDMVAEMDEAIELLETIINDEYDYGEEIPPHQQAQNDINKVFNLIANCIQGWWD